MIKIFNNPDDKIVNNFIKKSGGIIKNYGNPLIIEYNEKDYKESYHRTYEIECLISYINGTDKRFYANYVLVLTK